MAKRKIRFSITQSPLDLSDPLPSDVLSTLNIGDLTRTREFTRPTNILCVFCSALWLEHAELEQIFLSRK